MSTRSSLKRVRSEVSSSDEDEDSAERNSEEPPSKKQKRNARRIAEMTSSLQPGFAACPKSIDLRTPKALRKTRKRELEIAVVRRREQVKHLEHVMESTRVWTAHFTKLLVCFAQFFDELFVAVPPCSEDPSVSELRRSAMALSADDSGLLMDGLTQSSINDDSLLSRQALSLLTGDFVRRVKKGQSMTQELKDREPLTQSSDTNADDQGESADSMTDQSGLVELLKSIESLLSAKSTAVMRTVFQSLPAHSDGDVSHGDMAGIHASKASQEECLSRMRAMHSQLSELLFSESVWMNSATVNDLLELNWTVCSKYNTLLRNYLYLKPYRTGSVLSQASSLGGDRHSGVPLVLSLNVNSATLEPTSLVFRNTEDGSLVRSSGAPAGSARPPAVDSPSLEEGQIEESPNQSVSMVNSKHSNALKPSGSRRSPSLSSTQDRSTEEHSKYAAEIAIWKGKVGELESELKSSETARKRMKRELKETESRLELQRQNESMRQSVSGLRELTVRRQLGFVTAVMAQRESAYQCKAKAMIIALDRYRKLITLLIQDHPFFTLPDGVRAFLSFESSKHGSDYPSNSLDHTVKKSVLIKQENGPSSAASSSSLPSTVKMMNDSPKTSQETADDDDESAISTDYLMSVFAQIGRLECTSDASSISSDSHHTSHPSKNELSVNVPMSVGSVGMTHDSLSAMPPNDYANGTRMINSVTQNTTPNSKFDMLEIDLFDSTVAAIERRLFQMRDLMKKKHQNIHKLDGLSSQMKMEESEKKKEDSIHTLTQRFLAAEYQKLLESKIKLEKELFELKNDQSDATDSAIAQSIIQAIETSNSSSSSASASAATSDESPSSSHQSGKSKMNTSKIIQALTKEISKKGQQVLKVKSECDGDRLEWASKMAVLEKQNGNLVEQNYDANASLKRISEENKVFREKCRVLSEKEHRLESMINELKTMNRLLLVRMQNAEHERAVREKIIEQLREITSVSSVKCRSMNLECNTKRQLADALQSSKDDLQKQLDNISDKLQQSKQMNDELRCKMEELENERESMMRRKSISIGGRAHDSSHHHISPKFGNLIKNGNNNANGPSDSSTDHSGVILQHVVSDRLGKESSLSVNPGPISSSSSNVGIASSLPPSGDAVMRHQLTLARQRLVCSICTMNEKNRILTGCLHMFCEECLTQTVASRNRTCPLCKKKFSKSEIQPIHL